VASSPAAAVGAVHAEQLAERLVHLLHGHLVGAVDLDELAEQGDALFTEPRGPLCRYLRLII
jgi:hypothetical protein